MVDFLQENEIVVTAYAVKYRHVEYYDEYVVIEQNRIRRRVYKGWYFDDNGEYIHVSEYKVGMFQHKQKPKKYILNTETKEYRDYSSISISRHKPEKIEVKEVALVEELVK